MPRPLRVGFAGAIYHLMSRGDRQEPIFLDDVDRQTFLRTLGEACEKTGWQTHAYPLYISVRRRPPWLRVDRWLGEHGILEDGAPGRLEFQRRREQRRREGESPERLAACVGDGVWARRIFSGA